MLRITPIYGSSLSNSVKTGHDTNSNGDDDDDENDGNDDPLEWLSSPVPSCTLVEYAGMKLLLNAGWDESLPSRGGAGGHSPPAPEELPDVDAVLITDSTLSSLGALPLYFGASKDSKWGRRPRCRDGRVHSHGTAGDRRKSNPPFLATYPTVKMGQMTLYDHHASLSLDGCNPGYSLEDVDAVFSKDSFVTLKYSQTFYLPLDDADRGSADKAKKATKSKLLAVTPHLAGHVVGGCYYVLKRLADDTQVILAPTYHHAKEKHLAGCTLHKFGVNADALLTMPGGARGLLGRLYQPPPANKSNQSIIHYNKGKPILSPPMGNRSEAELIESIMAALRRDGNVLLPVDASGRVLELLLVLDRHWERQRLSGAYNLCWVGPMAYNTIEFARSQLEWMAEPLGAQFDSQRGHPYALKSVRICSSVSELEGVMERSNGNPTVVLASGPTLDHGPARDLLLKWGDNPDNLVLITDSTRCVPRGDVWFAHQGERPDKAAKEERRVLQEENETDDKLVGEAILPSDVSSYTTASQLLYQWCLAKAGGEEMADVVAIDVHVPHRAALAGAELKAFLAEEEAERVRIQAEAEKKAMMQEIEQAKGRLRLGEDEATGGAGSRSGVTGTSVSKGAGSGSTVGRPKKKSRFDQNLFIKFSKPIHMTFDFREEAVGIGQPDSVAKYGIGESVGRAGDVVEDDYGISVKAERLVGACSCLPPPMLCQSSDVTVAFSFVDIVTGVDPSKFSGGTGRIGEEVMRRGLGFGADGRPVLASSGGRPGETSENANDGVEDESGINEKMLEVADLSNGKGIVKGRNGRPPIKISTTPRKLEVLAEVSYIPLEGRVDARAARQSVRALQPRHLIVIGGPKANSKVLSDALGTMGLSDNKRDDEALTFAPADGDTVELTVGHAAYSVRLVDTPYMSQREKEAMELADTEIEPIEPYEAKIGECSVSLVDLVATGKKWAVDGSVVLAPRLQKSALNQSSLMLSTREVLLTDLRAEVTALGMKAEYGALSGYSQLIVNGKIYVRKDNITGKLDIEGPLCEDFYHVRSVVCGQYVTLTS
eukprot:CCRYP_016658-RA/>CCRYP_016658-RA protein AED:0.04 eAED:0.04 QI:46/1/0.8/1/1/1/5/107/1053